MTPTKRGPTLTGCHLLKSPNRFRTRPLWPIWNNSLDLGPAFDNYATSVYSIMHSLLLLQHLALLWLQMLFLLSVETTLAFFSLPWKRFGSFHNETPNISAQWTPPESSRLLHSHPRHSSTYPASSCGPFLPFRTPTMLPASNPLSPAPALPCSQRAHRGSSGDRGLRCIKHCTKTAENPGVWSASSPTAWHSEASPRASHLLPTRHRPQA